MTPQRFTVHSIERTMQGEGLHTGRVAVFCRFAGCNLDCRWCDTNQLAAETREYSRAELCRAIYAACDGQADGFEAIRFVVLTGGEPALQVNSDLVDVLHSVYGFEVAIETNGTMPIPSNLDWVTVSPKYGAPLVQRRGNELKLAYPQDGVDPADYLHLEFDYLYLQPITAKNGDCIDGYLAAAVDYCKDHPTWRLSLRQQTAIGLP